MTEVMSKPCIPALTKNHEESYQRIASLPEVTEVDNGDNISTYYHEQKRLETFKDWPLSFINKEALASSGFIFLKIGDLVKCVFCGVEIGEWEVGDIPHVDHKKWSPGCPLVKGRASHNIPISGSITTDGTINRGHDTCGKFGIELRPNSYADNDKQIKYRFDKSLLNPKYPHYASLDCRKQTYGYWPVSLKQRPEELVDAGFYYTGQGDRTICFFCGLGLNLWQEDDVPWEQHARWSPKCAYLLNKKPQIFVDEMVKKFSTTSMTETESVPTTSSSVKEETKQPLLSVTEEQTPTKEDEKTLCKICFSKEIGVVFLPCGHMVACVDCATNLTSCAVCRQKLDGTIRAYLS